MPAPGSPPIRPSWPINNIQQTGRCPMPFASAADGTRLYFETVGSGDPLVLVNGQGNDHRGWQHVRNDFAERYQVIVHDHRGTGASDKPESPAYTTRGFANDVIAILDHLQLQRAHVYGVSMGGR